MIPGINNQTAGSDTGYYLINPSVSPENPVFSSYEISTENSNGNSNGNSDENNNDSNMAPVTLPTNNAERHSIGSVGSQ